MPPALAVIFLPRDDPTLAQIPSFLRRDFRGDVRGVCATDESGLRASMAEKPNDRGLLGLNLP